MGCNHYTVSSVFMVFCLGHFVTTRYQYNSYDLNADSENDLACERIEASTEMLLSSLLYDALKLKNYMSLKDWCTKGEDFLFYKIINRTVTRHVTRVIDRN